MTEGELIRRAAAGDRSSVRSLYEAHATHVFATVRRIAGDDDLACDCAQDAWLRALRALPSFRGEARFSTWIHRIAVNVAIERSRQRSRTIGREVPVPEARPLPGSESERDPLLERRLKRALDALPEGMRQVLVLHDVEGYTHQEIGRSLEIAPGTSKSQLSRARARLRELLEPRQRTSGETPPRDGASTCSERHEVEA